MPGSVPCSLWASSGPRMCTLHGTKHRLNTFTAGYVSGTLSPKEWMAQPSYPNYSSYPNYPSFMHKSSHIHSTGSTTKPQTTLKKLANLDCSTWHIFSRSIKTFHTLKTPIRHDHKHTWFNTTNVTEYTITYYKVIWQASIVSRNTSQITWVLRITYQTRNSRLMHTVLPLWYNIEFPCLDPYPRAWRTTKHPTHLNLSCEHFFERAHATETQKLSAVKTFWIILDGLTGLILLQI